MEGFTAEAAVSNYYIVTTKRASCPDVVTGESLLNGPEIAVRQKLFF